MESHREITRLLGDIQAGNPASHGELMNLVYADLERIAGARLREWYGARIAGVTLEPAALVNETFLKLIKQRRQFDNRGHFFAVATKLMMQVLGDDHRRRVAAKRGSGIKISLGAVAEAAAATPHDPPTEVDIPALTAALDELEQLDSRKAEVAKLRLVWGLQINEIAEVLDVSVPTIERDWRFIRAWLAETCAGKPL
jgi:RNA polymerase sigma factor (TIGR02999 family)